MVFGVQKLIWAHYITDEFCCQAALTAAFWAHLLLLFFSESIVLKEVAAIFTAI
jgi:hypothetical protein